MNSRNQPANGASEMPAVFVGHGSPMNTIEHNRFTQAWADFGSSNPSPKAILAISAHWYVPGVAVTAMTHPRTIHDFGGFPDELFAVEYPAPGQPELAARIAEIVKPIPAQLNRDWGLDHGTWSVLAHMYPEAEIPVVQLSIDTNASISEHMNLGAALAPLRREGVLIVASGNVVHNLKLMQWHQPDSAFQWATEFDDEARGIMTSQPDRAAELTDHRLYDLSAPTPEHFLPLLYIAGLAAASNTAAETIVCGHTMGSISMTSYVLPGASDV
jgi:4,5-DOPA dioxygenase extradiol